MFLTHNTDAVLLQSEQVARFTFKNDFSRCLGVFDWTYKELVLAEKVREYNSENNCRESSADESFPSLFWTQFDQRCFSEEKAKHVSHYIVAHDHHYGNNEPNQS